MKYLILLMTLFASLQAAEWGPPFAYEARDYSNLYGMPGFDKELLSTHFTLYEGYVKNINLVLNQLREMDEKGEERSYDYGAIKRRLGWEYDGMVLHQLYFSNLGGDGVLDKESDLYQAIVADFGSYENWKKDFIATGMIRGIGWAILYRSPEGGRLINTWINEHDVGHLAGGVPLLVMDVWEHAYMLQYILDRAAYIDAFFQNINWQAVLDRTR